MLSVLLASLCCLFVVGPEDPPSLRPVESQWRESLKLPAPRDANAILAELDAVPDEDLRIPEMPEGWRVQQRENELISRRRVSLISELEEGGYSGPRLQELLRLKLQELGKVANSQEAGYSEPLYLMRELRDRHKGEPIGARTQLYLYSRAITQLRRAGLHVSESDLQQIADAELLVSKDPLETEAGSLLERALEDQSSEVRTKWMTWAKESLPPTSLIHREEARRNAFGKPIRLQGPSLEGDQIDTANWRGSVILVDFWGSWCGPCKQVMPTFQELLTKYESRGFRVVGIAVDQPDRARNYLKSTSYKWPHITDADAASSKELIPDNRIAVEYAVRTFPTVWLIDRKGILRKAPHAHEKEKLEAVILELLEQPTPASASDSEATSK